MLALKAAGTGLLPCVISTVRALANVRPSPAPPLMWEGERSPGADVSPASQVPVQMWRGASPVPAQMWQG